MGNHPGDEPCPWCVGRPIALWRLGVVDLIGYPRASLSGRRGRGRKESFGNHLFPGRIDARKPSKTLDADDGGSHHEHRDVTSITNGRGFPHRSNT